MAEGVGKDLVDLSDGNQLPGSATRRSGRANLGQLPDRFGYNLFGNYQQESAEQEVHHSTHASPVVKDNAGMTKSLAESSGRLPVIRRSVSRESINSVASTLSSSTIVEREIQRKKAQAAVAISRIERERADAEFAKQEAIIKARIAKRNAEAEAEAELAEARAIASMARLAAEQRVEEERLELEILELQEEEPNSSRVDYSSYDDVENTKDGGPNQPGLGQNSKALVVGNQNDSVVETEPIIPFNNERSSKSTETNMFLNELTLAQKEYNSQFVKKHYDRQPPSLLTSNAFGCNPPEVNKDFQHTFRANQDIRVTDGGEGFDCTFPRPGPKPVVQKSGSVNYGGFGFGNATQEPAPKPDQVTMDSTVHSREPVKTYSDTFGGKHWSNNDQPPSVRLDDFRRPRQDTAGFTQKQTAFNANWTVPLAGNPSWQRKQYFNTSSGHWPNTKSGESHKAPPPPSSFCNAQQHSMSHPDAMNVIANALSLLANNQASHNSDDSRWMMVRQTMQRDLPTFSGDPEEWGNFAAAYIRSTNVCRFSDDENLSRLHKALKGKAKEVVQDLMITPNNIPAIMQTLEFHFGRPEDMLRHFTNKIKSLPNFKEGDNASLMNLATKVRSMTSTMVSLNCTNDLYNPALLEEIVAKLPANLKTNWGYRLFEMNRRPGLNDLSEWLIFNAQCAKLVSPAITAESKPKPKETEKPKKKDVVAVVNTKGNNNQSSQSKQGDRNERNCLYCASSGHIIYKCKALLDDTVDKRWETITSQRLCFSCLRPGHNITGCATKRECGRDGCKLQHNRLLHKPIQKRQPKDPSKERSTEPPKPEPQVEAKDTVCATSGNISKIRYLLQVVPVNITGPKGTMKVHALLDPGANVTLLDSSVARSVGLSGKRDSLCISYARGEEYEDKKSQRVSFDVCSTKSGEKFTIEDAHTVDGLQLPVQSVDVPAIKKVWNYILDSEVESYHEVQPKLLIGSDNYDLICARKIIGGPKNAPFMTMTKLGWVLHGATSRSRKAFKYNGARVMFVSGRTKEDYDLHNQMKDYFSLEQFGITPNVCRMSSAEDAKAIEVFEKTTKRISGGFETGLLFKHENVQLPESKAMALKRFSTLQRKMEKDPEFGAKYTTAMEGFISKGYARRLTPEEEIISDGKVWYLPHFAVINHRKPEKVRPVFDAAAKCHGICLNDTLLVGPDLLTSIPSNLFAFRHRPIPLTADVEEMFLRIKIRPEDQVSQRFFWSSSQDNGTPKPYVMMSMLFGAKSSPFSAQSVKNKNAQEFTHEFPAAVKAIIEKHYMDNYIDSVNTEEEAMKLINDINEVHQRAGFRMRGWASSNQSLMQKIPEDLRSSPDQSLVATERILGSLWGPTTDELRFDMKFNNINQDILAGRAIPTKREILKVVMSIFDPLGIASHLTIRGRILLQEIWRTEVGWDDAIPEPLQTTWKDFISTMGVISDIRIPRYYGAENQCIIDNVQIHVFADASEYAYAAVVYFRYEIGSTVRLSFVMGKSRVSPLKPLSIPRKELLAAVMAARLATTVKSKHDFCFTSTHFWSDSRIVLAWLRQDARKFQTFVANRIGEIEELTQTKEWKWVPTKQNPADIATRPSCKSEDRDRWINGPEFLLLPSTEWPTEKDSTDVICSEDFEVKPHHVVATVVEQLGRSLFRFSNWFKQIRMIARILRLRRPKSAGGGGSITVDEQLRAEKACIRLAQKESFGTLMTKLTKKKLKELQPFKDEDGIQRCRGRLEKSIELSFDTRHPIILDGKHSYTQMLITWYHLRVNHHGQATVMNDLRQKYWILRLRQAVRKAWFDCQKCKNDRSNPRPPVMAPLPSVRLTKVERPFIFTGVDYFGPMEVTIGRRHEKRWGVLFTCLSIRAVHIEVASSLTTDSAVMAMRRFIARRRQPLVMHSDNGTNFKGAASELIEAYKELSDDKISDELAKHGVQWKFIPPHSPHFGGTWERLVGSIKTALKAVLNERYPKDEVLHTLLCEAESIVNRHPLTGPPIDPDDARSLTPFDFLIPQGNDGPTKPMTAFGPPGHFSDDDFYHRKQWRMAQRLADQFWTRWVKEYLPTLSRREKWIDGQPPIKVGDIVKIVEDEAIRNSWELAKVIDVHPGQDGIIRVATVQTARKAIYKRPVTKLCILDVQPQLDESEPSSGGACRRENDHDPTQEMSTTSS